MLNDFPSYKASFLYDIIIFTPRIYGEKTNFLGITLNGGKGVAITHLDISPSLKNTHLLK